MEMLSKWLELQKLQTAGPGFELRAHTLLPSLYYSCYLGASDKSFATKFC